MDRKSIAKKTAAIHNSVYARDPQIIAYAPGRVEILGNHTDYNEGMVLSAAIDMGTCFAISSNEGAGSPGEKAGLQVYAGNYDDHASFNLNEVSPVPGHDWANYVKGVLYYIQEYMQEQGHSRGHNQGYSIDNWDCSFYGTIPIGSGLSSSAALEVSTAYAAQAMLNIELDAIDTAIICQASEHNFVGSMTGLLDQFSSIFGEKNHLIHSDFRSNKVSTVKIPESIRFLLLSPGLSHSLADSPYNERRERCEEALAALADIMHPPKGEKFTLRDVDMATFLRVKERLPSEAAQRAEHVVGEIDRVSRGLLAVERGDISLFGELMYESHESSRVQFENSIPELDLLVKLAREEGAIGARLSGGGWGGSVIAMLDSQNAQNEDIEQRISAAALKAGITVSTRLITPSAGVGLIHPPFGV